MNHSTETLRITLDVPMSMRPAMSLIQQSYRYGIIIFGTLLNFLVIAVVRYSRQLHYPRHVFWAAIALVNQLSVVQALLEMVAIAKDNRVACQIFVLNAGVFYSVILTFLALAGLDRYLATTRHEWYKNKVTNRRVIYLLSFSYFVTYMTITSPFWTGIQDIKDCTINLTHMHYVMIYDLLLGILCILLHAMIFFRSRKAISKQPPNFLETSIALQFLPINSINVNTPEVQRTERNLQEANEMTMGGIHDESQRAEDVLCFSWFFNRPKLNRLEIRAALSMSINVLPVWLCTLPVTVNAIIIYWCVHQGQSCPIAFKINPYFRNLFFVHIVYNPLMYMTTSTEFKRAMVRIKEKCKISIRGT